MPKRKVLLAEDDEDDQRFFNEFLENRKDTVLLPIAENGEVLFDILGNITKDTDLPDLIILDQNMPKISGLNALRLLKADSRYAHIPVSIYSTYTDEELIKNGLALGACFVVPKPISWEGYHRMMDRLFEACISPVYPGKL
jgi:CheY-like chemotaxis protein